MLSLALIRFRILPLESMALEDAQLSIVGCSLCDTCSACEWKGSPLLCPFVPEASSSKHHEKSACPLPPRAHVPSASAAWMRLA